MTRGEDPLCLGLALRAPRAHPSQGGGRHRAHGKCSVTGNCFCRCRCDDGFCNPNKTGLPWGPASSPCPVQKKRQSDIPASVKSSLNLPDLSETPKGPSAHHTQSVLEALSANVSARKVSWELLQKHLPSLHPPFILLRAGAAGPGLRRQGTGWTQALLWCLRAPCLSLLICKTWITKKCG